MLKKYQPDRPDILINTDWGIPSDHLSSEAAKSRRLKLFHGRWVTTAEKNQLQDEPNLRFDPGYWLSPDVSGALRCDQYRTNISGYIPLRFPNRCVRAGGNGMRDRINKVCALCPIPGHPDIYSIFRFVVYAAA